MTLVGSIAYFTRMRMTVATALARLLSYWQPNIGVGFEKVPRDMGPKLLDLFTRTDTSTNRERSKAKTRRCAPDGRRDLRENSFAISTFDVPQR